MRKALTITLEVDAENSPLLFKVLLSPRSCWGIQSYLNGNRLTKTTVGELLRLVSPAFREKRLSSH
jgi:hypothetical protein